MRWELNELARGLDQRLPVEPLATASCGRRPTVAAAVAGQPRMLAAIEALPEEEREAFSLVRIQELSAVEAAEVLGVSSKTVQRRIHRSMWMLAAALDDLRPGPADPHCRTASTMVDGEPLVLRLLEEVLETGRSVEDVCASHPALADGGPPAAGNGAGHAGPDGRAVPTVAGRGSQGRR
jgi:predicted DNA-binding protein (UPF0251 family)